MLGFRADVEYSIRRPRCSRRTQSRSWSTGSCCRVMPAAVAPPTRPLRSATGGEVAAAASLDGSWRRGSRRQVAASNGGCVMGTTRGSRSIASLASAGDLRRAVALSVYVWSPPAVRACSSRGACADRWLVGDEPAEGRPVLAGVGVPEVEQVAVQVCQCDLAAAGREWLDHLELAESEVTGERPEVGGAVWCEPQGRAARRPI